MEDRNYSISIIRLISMLMIISCHILQGMKNKWAFWINVGVQIFLFISGFLFGKKKIINNNEFYKKRLTKIFIPYLIVLTIMLVLDILLLKNSYSIKKIIGCYIGFGAFGNSIPILSHTWFVSYIILCYMIVPILQSILNKKTFKNNFILFLLIIFLIQILQIYKIINIEASWINNFIFGYFYSKCCNEKENERIFNSFVIILFIITIPFAIIYQEHIQVNLPKILNSNSQMIMNYGHVILGTVIFITLYKILNHFRIKKSKILDFSDEYSYYIYLVHQIFILKSFSILFLTRQLIINIILILLLSIISGAVIKTISDLLMNYIKRFLNF